MDNHMNNVDITKLSSKEKKEIISQLLNSLLDNSNEADKKNILKKIFSRSGVQVIDMVEH